MHIREHGFYYGWVLVAAGIVLLAVTVGIVLNCMPLYIVPICDEMSFSRRAGGFINTLISLGGMVVAAVSPRIYKAVPIKTVMRMCAVILSAAYFTFSLATGLWMFYGISMVISVSMWSLAYIPLAAILSNWFHRRTGFVIGITYMGTGVGGMIFNPIVGSLIESAGWRGCAEIMAAVIAAVAIPCTLLMRDTPAEMGLEPYGYEPSLSGAEPRHNEEDITFGEAVKTKAFVMMALGMLLMSFSITSFSSTLVPYLSDLGYSIIAAASINAGTMASLAVGKMLLGGLYDKYGCSKGTIISGMFLLSCVLSSLFLPSRVSVAIILITFSLGFAFGTVAAPVISRATFGMKDFNRINSTFNSLNSMASACGPLFCGILCDAVGSYAAAYRVLIAVISVAVMLLLTGLRSFSRYRENRQ